MRFHLKLFRCKKKGNIYRVVDALSPASCSMSGRSCNRRPGSLKEKLTCLRLTNTLGGGGVDVIIGIKYLKHYPTFLFPPF